MSRPSAGTLPRLEAARPTRSQRPPGNTKGTLPKLTIDLLSRATFVIVVPSCAWLLQSKAAAVRGPAHGGATRTLRRRSGDRLDTPHERRGGAESVQGRSQGGAPG